MRHLRNVSAGRPAIASDDIATITAVVALATAIVGLLGQISSVFGISFSLTSKSGA